MAATTYFFITPPIKNQVWQFWCFVTSQANTNVFQTTVTLAPGDVTALRDGVSIGNLDTLPVEVGATGCLRVDLSADEMNGDEMTVIKFSDVAGNEWQDAAFIVMPMEAVTVAQQVDILNDATPFAGANINQSLSTTETNIRGADGDDLKDISDEIAALNDPTVAQIAASIWTHDPRTLTQSAAQIAAIVAGSTVTVPPYTTWIINLTGLGSIADRAQLYATFKESSQVDTDANALIQVEETIGLVIANKAPAPNPALASIVVTDAAAGDITITVDESVTGFPVRLGMGYDVKKITVGGDAILMTIGTFNISDIVTRTIV